MTKRITNARVSMTDDPDFLRMDVIFNHDNSTEMCLFGFPGQVNLDPGEFMGMTASAAIELKEELCESYFKRFKKEQCKH